MTNELERIGRELLVALGEDPTREGLRETPRRFAAAWVEFMNYEPGNADTTFESVTANQMVIVKNIRVWSICEHHLLPFWCDVTIGYITGNKVLGLSKFARIAHDVAHRLQLQERIVMQIGDRIEKVCEVQDVAVIACGEHSCMTMRGVRTPATMISSNLRGRFRTDPAMRAEFMMLAK